MVLFITVEKLLNKKNQNVGTGKGPKTKAKAKSRSVRAGVHFSVDPTNLVVFTVY